MDAASPPFGFKKLSGAPERRSLCRNRANPLRSSVLDWNACPAVDRADDKLSGAWVFRNTRVPVKALFENLESGATIDEFLAWFPGVTREQAQGVLEFAEKTLVTS